MPGLAVADDQLALAAADGNHRVDGLDTGLQRLAHRLAIDHAGRDALQRDCAASAAMGPLPSIGSPSGLTTRPTIASPTGTDIIVLVRLTTSPSCNSLYSPSSTTPTSSSSRFKRDAENVVREREHLAGHDFFQAVNARDAVAHADDRADFVDGNGLLVIFDLLAQNLADFIRVNFGHSCS